MVADSGLGLEGGGVSVRGVLTSLSKQTANPPLQNRGATTHSTSVLER